MLLLTQVVLLTATLLPYSNADVKHVLDGSAQPPQHVHTYECQYPQIPLVPGYPAGYAPAPNNAVPGSAAFWWADNNSPFRRAYEYFKKCSESGNCPPPLPPPAPNRECNSQGCTANRFEDNQGKDVNTNHFLNGQSAGFPSSSPAGDKLDFAKNPFLNGNFGNRIPNTNVISPSEKPDFSRNPFLNGDGVKRPAYSGSGQPIGPGAGGFLGVQPSIPFGSVAPVTNKQPTIAPFVPSGNTQNGNSKRCNGRDQICIEPELCVNGVVSSNGAGLFDQRTVSDYCERDNKVCCRLPEETTSPTQSNSLSSFGSASSISFSSTPAASPINGSPATFPNIKDLQNRHAAPGSVFNFGGGDGLSPISIQVVSDNNEGTPNLQVSNDGESGSGLIPAAASQAPIFASTPDFSNADLSHIPFASTIHGPPYLPPDASPKPDIHIPDLVAPSISTYEPFIPSTPRPIVTKPVFPGPSIVSVHTQPSSIPPFIPSHPQPFNPIEFVPSLTPSSPAILPLIPSSPAPFFPQSPVRPFPLQPTIKVPLPPVVLRPQPSTPIISIDNRFKPSETPTPGYSYPTPTPPFGYPSSTTHRPSISINDNFIPVKGRPTPKPYNPQPLFPSTPIVSIDNRFKPFPSVVPEPIEPQQPFIISSPSTPQISLDNRHISVTPGYSYPTPSPPFGYPSPSTPKPSFSINDNFIPVQTKPTPKPYRPQPSVEYEYKKPTPAFSFPTIKPFNPQPQPSEEFGSRFSTTVNPPTIRVTNNQYLPPFENPQINPDGSSTNEFVIKPTVKPPLPPIIHEGQPDVQIPNIIGYPKPQPPSIPQVGCAAALKCVQEIYCTAEGVISPVPVILSKAQQLLRVPTTECRDPEAGIIGRCCRDPNYVDPWPSANSLNGFDDGQYREDPRLGQYQETQNLGQYFPSNRPQRSEAKVKTAVRSAPNAIASELANTNNNNNNNYGVRNYNSQPRSNGPNEVTFGEIPWQAMILRDSTRKLLCGGVIVKPNAVLTSAQCLDGLATSDILIKGGEWKLGIDEEPLPFQIVKVAAIIRHPSYKQGVLENDLALLMLEEKLRIAKNIVPIRLSKTPQTQQQQQCIATGWGKRILQVHLRGAIMRAIDVNILDNQQCKEVLHERYPSSAAKHFESTICGFSKNDQCDVDYGSALACSNGDGIYSLAGIFSWDTGCKDDGQLGGYIAPDSEWIEDTCSKPLSQLKAIDRKYNSQA